MNSSNAHQRKRGGAEPDKGRCLDRPSALARKGEESIVKEPAGSVIGAREERRCAAHRVPFDVIAIIVSHYATLSPSCARNALLVSRTLSSSVEEGVYGCVSLFSISAMESFHSLLKRRPELGRRVKGLWIAPCRSDSDLIPALAPPTNNEAMEARQRKVQALAREILRSCRRSTHLALDGGFLTPQCAVGFGTACKPTTLLCVNPHSFLGHFSAPIFRTSVRRLEVVDTTLAVEEVDEIRQMQGLRHFHWTAPRANSDVTRDVSVLLRILSPRARDLSSDERERHLMELVARGGSAPPEKARLNADLRSICTATSQARAAALAASFKKVVDSIEHVHEEPSRVMYAENEDEDEDEASIQAAVRAIRAGFYVDSSCANSTSLHKPSGVELQTQALSSLMHALTVSVPQKARKAPVRHKGEDVHGNADVPDEREESEEDDDDEVVEEWEALRDVVCQRRTANSTASSRLFAGVGSASGATSNATTLHMIRSGASSGTSTPGWAVSRAGSPTRNAVNSSGVSSAKGSGTATPSRRPEEEIDGGRALQRVWRRWQKQLTSGELNIY